MVQLIVNICMIYVLLGIVFSIPFVIWGVYRTDEDALGSRWGFRLIIIPGVIIFWPILLIKWIRSYHDTQAEKEA